jgi:hypothetical protein
MVLEKPDGEEGRKACKGVISAEILGLAWSYRGLWNVSCVSEFVLAQDKGAGDSLLAVCTLGHSGSRTLKTDLHRVTGSGDWEPKNASLKGTQKWKEGLGDAAEHCQHSVCFSSRGNTHLLS